MPLGGNANPLFGPRLVDSLPDDVDSLRRLLVQSTRAKRLLDNEDFRWWTDEIVAKWTDGQHIKVVWDDPVNDRDLHVRRGIIRGVQRVLRNLNSMASRLDVITARLEDLDGRRTDHRDI